MSNLTIAAIQSIPKPENEDDWKVCRVCQDRATGYHFNAMTCEGCKGFFRRAIKGSKKFACAYENNCQIEKRSRRHCSACRFNKCIEVGMKKECIMSDEQIHRKRALIARNRLKRQAMARPTLSDSERSTIKVITKSFADSFDLTFIRRFGIGKKQDQSPQCDMLSMLGIGNVEGANVCLLTIMRILFPMPNEQQSVIKVATSGGGIMDANLQNIDGQIKQLNETYLRYFSDLLSTAFREIIDFSKNIPGFDRLDISDQVALIKGSCIEMLFIKTNHTFSIEDETFQFGHINYNVEPDQASGLTQEFVDLYLNFHRKLKSLHLGTEEFAMIMSICLFSSDRQMVTKRDLIDEIQTDLSLAFQNYLSSDMGSSRTRIPFHQIVGLLLTLRSLSAYIFKSINDKVKMNYEELSVGEVSPGGSSPEKSRSDSDDKSD